MKRIRALAGRELRAYFNSPIAYVFLLVFVGAALFTFFNLNAFFSRGRADLRGLFDAVPFLMVLLVPGLLLCTLAFAVAAAKKSRWLRDVGGLHYVILAAVSCGLLSLVTGFAGFDWRVVFGADVAAEASALPLLFGRLLVAALFAVAVVGLSAVVGQDNGNTFEPILVEALQDLNNLPVQQGSLTLPQIAIQIATEENVAETVAG